MIRKLHFENNILGGRIEMDPAEYSVLGHYDGLSIQTFPDNTGYEILSGTHRTAALYNSFDIIGRRSLPDDCFWEKGGAPFIFISCLRLKKASDNLEKISDMIERKYNAVCYLTVDSSDLVVCLRSCSYRAGYETVVGYHKIIRECEPENELQISFSAVAIWQKVLDRLEKVLSSDREEFPLDDVQKEVVQLQKERISAFLRVNVEKWEEFEKYLMKLKSVAGSAYKGTFEILGSEDAVIWLDRMDSHDFLRLYADNALLTRANELYRRGIMNIRTELAYISSRGA